MVNRLTDFEPENSTIFAFCGDCDHSSTIDRSRTPDSVTIPQLTAQLRCGNCRSKRASIWIAYTGAGRFAYGR